MADNQIGLVAILDLAGFNRSYRVYLSALNDMNLTTLNTSKSLSGSFLGLGDSLLKIATIMSVAVVAGATVALVAITKLAISGIKQAAELEQQIANIAAVMGVTGEQAGFLQTTIMDLGLDPRLKATTFEAAEAIELLAKNGIFAGMTVEQMATTAKDAATAVILLANATGADYGQAANIATSAMILFGEEASSLVDIVSGITGVTTTSKLTIDDYELALRNGGAAVAEFGVELSDFNTMVAISAEELGTGMKVGTGWLNFMNRLTPNTEKASDMMKELGLMTADGTNRFFDANGELKDMTEISKILNEVLYGTTKVVSEVSNRTAEQNALLAELNGEYQDAKATIADYTTGVSGLLATEEEKNKAISEAQAIIDKISPRMAELNGISSDYVTTLQNLTTEQRMVAIETLFGNDGMKSAIALAKEGARTTADYTEIMNIFGVDSIGAYKLIAGGLTDFEVAQRKIENVDGIQAAVTRMDTLKGKLEILGGVFEALKISFGDPLVVLFGNLADKAIEWWEANKDLQDQFKALGKSFADLFDSLIQGKGFMDSFTNFLEDVGGSDVADKFTDIATSIQDFIDPIIVFVQDHAAEFEGALKGIGVVLATAMAASLIMGVVGALWALVNPATALILLAAGLGAAFETNFGGIRDKVFAARDAINEFGSMMTGIKDFKFDGLASIETFISALGQMDWSLIDWSGIKDSFMTQVSTLGETFGEVISGIDWATVGKTFVTLFGNAIVVAIGTMTLVGETLYTFIEGVVTNTDWSGIGNSLWEGILSGADNLGNIKIPSLGEEFNGTIETLGAGSESIDTLGEAFGTLMKKAQPVIGFFTALRDTVKPSVDKIIDAFTNFKFVMVDWNSATGEGTADIWIQLSKTWEALSPIIVGLISVVATLWGTFVAFASGVLGGAIEPLLTGLGMAFTGILQMVEGIATTITSIGGIIVGIFTGDREKVLASWQSWREGTVLIFEGMFNAIVGIVGYGLEAIVQGIAGGLQSVYDFFYNLYVELVGASIVPDMINAIVAWFFSLDDQLVALVSEMVASLLTWFTNLTVNTLLKITLFVIDMGLKFTELFVKIRTIVEEKVTELLEKFKTFLTDVIQIFEDKKNDFFIMGQNIMNGIIDGITNKLESAKAAILGVAEGVKEAWDNFWNSHSPSRVMMESGQDIMAGATIGVMKSVESLMSAMSFAGGSAISSFTDTAANILPHSPNVGSSNSSSVVNNNYALNNSFAGNPQITDVGQLEMTLAGYR